MNKLYLIAFMMVSFTIYSADRFSQKFAQCTQEHKVYGNHLLACYKNVLSELDSALFAMQCSSFRTGIRFPLSGVSNNELNEGEKLTTSGLRILRQDYRERCQVLQRTINTEQ